MNVQTPPCRLSYPNLFEPRARAQGKDPEYGCALLFDEDADLSDLKAAVKAAAIAQFGEVGGMKVLKTAKGNPFRKQADKEQYGDSGYFINAHSKTQPGIVDRHVKDIIDKEEVFAGLLVRATVRAFAWDHPEGGKGVSLGLQNLQVLKDDGTRYDGRTKATEDFDVYESDDPEEAETASADDLF